MVVVVVVLIVLGPLLIHTPHLLPTPENVIMLVKGLGWLLLLHHWSWWSCLQTIPAQVFASASSCIPQFGLYRLNTERLLAAALHPSPQCYQWLFILPISFHQWLFILLIICYLWYSIVLMNFYLRLFILLVIFYLRFSIHSQTSTTGSPFFSWTSTCGSSSPRQLPPAAQSLR